MGRTFDKLTTSARIMVRVLIVGNSKIPNDLIVKHLVKNSDVVIACDGAIERCLVRQIKADYVIGDMDSLENQTIEDLQLLGIEVIKIDSQDENDLTKSIIFASKLNATKIDIIGVEGGSNQHQFASYWAIIDCKTESYIHLEDCIVSKIDSTSKSFSIEVGKTFSVFPVGLCNGVSITGSKWIIDNEDITPSSRGLHNIATEKEIRISCIRGQLLLFRSR
jgi:thiamine pyrophosphokinase